MELPSLFSSLSCSSFTNFPTGVEESRNWEELPRDIIVMILMKLEAREILESAQFVCKSWHEACKDPAAWTRIVLHFSRDPELRHVYQKIAYAAVNRSCGRLLEISVDVVCNRFLLLHIAQRSSNLRCLRIRFSDFELFGDSFFEAFKMLPLLEEAEFTVTELDCSLIKCIGESCPKLASFKLNQKVFKNCIDLSLDYNECVLAIAESMPRIHHLQLIGNMMTNESLEAILDSCSCLELLDLRACFKLELDLSGDLRKRCAEKVRVVKWPNDSTSDCCFVVMADYHDEDEVYFSDEYGYGRGYFSDLDETFGFSDEEV